MAHAQTSGRYCYDSDLGVFVLVLRTWVYVYFVLSVSRTKALEESVRKGTPQIC